MNIELASFLLIFGSNLLLLGWILWMDIKYKEPAILIIVLLLCGGVASRMAGAMNYTGGFYLAKIIDENSFLYTACKYILVVGLVEEGVKYFFVNALTWNNPAYSSRFDAIVYCVAVATGFSFDEDIQYVFFSNHDMFSTAVVRSESQILGHVAFAVLVGLFYGLAKEAENYFEEVKCVVFKIAAWIIPAIVHGIYDIMVTSLQGNAETAAKIVYVAVLFGIEYCIFSKFDNEFEDINVNSAFRKDKPVKARHIVMIGILGFCYLTYLRVFRTADSKEIHIYFSFVVAALLVLLSLYNYICNRIQMAER